MRQVMDKLTLNDKLQTQFKDLFTQATSKLEDFRKQLDNGILDARGLKKFETTGRELANVLDNIAKKTQSIGTGNLPKIYSGDPTEIAAAQKAIEDARQAYDNMATAAGKYRTEADQVIALLNTQKEGLKSSAKSWQELINAINAGKFDSFEKYLNNLAKTNLKNNAQDLEAVRQAVEHLRQTGQGYNDNIIKAEDNLEKFNISAQQQAIILNVLQGDYDSAAKELHNFVATQVDAVGASVAAQEAVDQLGNKLKLLLSYGSGIALLRKSVRNAYNTIKELDAAMTETATVTDYSVSQMWEKLDEYTEIANKLGATTLGTYKTITLFFQQGLDEQQSLALATETMKMARVANIDYAEATEYMTSALRGFNMELNETSATRVNDVYSELAKITAADTNQIAIAMSKVASLANSANMELETTSAFLAQIIETTQEAPETAGTALKTIIARFSEVKKLFNQGDITGTDENGDVIDVNKIGAALRNVGIDLNQYIAGNVGLDQIFLELAEKWDSLSLVQQRYIATQAAGSRQQSRFIAMMQNYSRTMELVNAAYNSAGSGQEQFEKTLESIEAKLNKLKNAWDTFSTSIANSDLVKNTVDLFTQLLTVINNLTDAFGKFSGVAKVLLGLGIFKLGNNLLGGQAGPLAMFGQTLKEEKNIFTAFSSMSDPLQKNMKVLTDSFLPFSTAKKVLSDLHKEQQTYAKDLKISDEAKVKYDALGNAITNLQDDLDTEKFRQYGNVISVSGIAISALGTGISKLGESLDSETLQNFGDFTGKIGQMAIAAGQFVKFMPEITTTLEKLVEVMGGVGALTSFFLAFGSFALVMFDCAQSTEKARQALESFNNSASKITDDLTTISNKVNGLKDLQNQLNLLQKGTLAWDNQLLQVQNAYNELIDLYPELADFIKLTENGIDIDEYQYKKYTQNQTQKSNSIRTIDQVQNAIKSNASYGINIDENGNEKLGILSNTQFDLQALSSIFGGLSEDTVEAIAKDAANEILTILNNASGYSNDSNNAVIKELQDRLGYTDDSWLSMGIDELVSLLETIIIIESGEEAQSKAVESGELVSPLIDKTGQTIYSHYMDSSGNFNGEGKQLTEELKASLDTNSTASALKTYWENLDNLYDVIGRNTNALRALSLETADAMKNYDALNAVLKDNKDILESEEDSISRNIAVAEAYNAARQALGDGLNFDYFESNLPQFLAAFVDGSEEALFQIQQDIVNTFDLAGWLATQDIPVELNPTDVENIQNLIQEIISSKEMQVNGYADFTRVYDALNALGADGAALSQALAQMLTMEAHIVTDSQGNVKVNVSNPGVFAARNYRSAGGGGKSSGGSGGGSSKKEKPWENPYDQLYNLTERNEEAIRRRNILEKQYNAILRDREGTSTQLLRNSLQELANLQEQLSYQRQLQRGRKAQLDAVNSEMYMDSEGTRKSYSAWGVTKYASYNQQTNAIEIDWDAIDRVTDEQTGKAIEDYVKRLEELQKQFEQVDSDILDIEEEIDEINQRGKGEYLDFEQRVYDAIVQTYQDVIDSFSSLNDTINDSNDKILNDLQEQIDLERQIRDNTKTEEEIGDKETRLAYLQRDTSGANATEILKLQEEIADARQNYTDNLIDQKLSQLAKDNDAAAEQRQTQIAIMQEQLDYWTQIGAFWSRVDTLLSEAINEDGSLKNNSDLVTLLMNDENFGGLSKFGKQGWEDDLVKSFMESMEGYGKWMIEEAEKKGEITQDGNTYKYNKDRKAWMLGNEAYSAVYNPAAQRYEFTRVKDKDVQVGTIGSGNTTSGGGNSGGSGGGGNSYTPSTTTDLSTDWGEWMAVSYSQKDAYSHYVNWRRSRRKRDGSWESETKRTTEGHIFSGNICTKCNYHKTTTSSGGGGGGKVMTRQAGGGMVYETGPTWLDGTKANPEAVLSAKQTEMFISLRDLLERITQSGGLTSNSFGNTYVDLDVNADIGSDYDVDSLVNRLKRDILESSNYRNVNALTRGH